MIEELRSESKSASGGKVAVVILSWNGKEMIEEYLSSVIASNYADLEVVVADNHSDDGSATLVREKFPSVRLIELERNFGFAAGYNEALQRIRAEYFVLLNQDVEVTPNWLEPMIALMEKDRTIAACQPKIKDLRHRERFEYAGAAGGYLDALGYPFCRGRVFETIEEDSGQYDDVVECAWASGAAICVRADLFHRFGGLDADFVAHMEEIDLCWRLRNAGYRIMCCPQSVVYHVGGASLARGNPRKTFLNFRNSFVTIIKNERGAKLLWLVPVRWLLDVVAGLKFLLSGQWRDWLAVIKAHLHVFFRLGKWWRSRRHSIAIINANRIGEPSRARIIGGSIVWKYFVKGRKRFSDLNSSTQ